jgi:hypothetical protein
MLAKHMPAREWKQLKGIEIAGQVCDFEGEVLPQGSTPDGYGRAWWTSEDCWYRGRFQAGSLHGQGVFAMRNGDRFAGVFENDRPAGAGTLSTSDGRRRLVEYASDRTLLEDIIPTPISSEPCAESVVDEVRRVYTAACMRAGDGAKENDYGHIKSMHGKVAFAVPFRAHKALLNHKYLRGKIAVVQRGGCPFGRKLMHVQEAGAVAMIIVGIDDRDLFGEVVQITQGRLPATPVPLRPDLGGDTTPGAATHSASCAQFLHVRIPVTYVLGKDEEQLQEGMLCRLTFLPRTPRTPECWFLGSIDIPKQTCYAEESEESTSDLLEVCLPCGATSLLGLRLLDRCI